MRRFLSLAAAFLLLMAFCALPVLAYTVPHDTIVYVTPTGEKYHREGCTHTTAVTALTIRTAERQGYTPCSRCRPDILTGIYVSTWDGDAGESGSSGTVGNSLAGTSSPSGKSISLSRILTWCLLLPAALIYLLLFVVPLLRVCFEALLEFIRNVLNQLRHK